MILNSELKKLRNNFISLLILKGGNYIIPLITLPFLVGKLGIEKFGLIAFAEMIILYFKSIVDYGYDLTGTRLISENINNRNEVNRHVSNIFIIKLILVLLCFFLLIFLIYNIDSLFEISRLLIYSYGIVIGNALLPSWFFQGMEKMKYITIVNFISRLIYMLLLFVFINTESDFIYVPLLNSLGFVIGGISSIIIMKKVFKVNFIKPQKRHILKRFKEDFNVFISTLAPNLYNNSMGVLLGFYTNNIQVGYYSAATKLIEVGVSFVNIISTTIFPHLNKSNNYKQKIVNWTMLLSILISSVYFLFSKQIVILLFGNSMESSIIVLKIISMSPLFIAMMSIYGTNTLIIDKRDSLVRNIILFYSILGLLLGLLFIKYYGIIAAALILVLIRGLIGFSEYLIVKNNLFKNV
jgi:PST family polysaccharide transporter